MFNLIVIFYSGLEQQLKCHTFHQNGAKENKSLLLRYSKDRRERNNPSCSHARYTNLTLGSENLGQ